jgi:hypothetical protein
MRYQIPIAGNRKRHPYIAVDVLLINRPAALRLRIEDFAGNPLTEFVECSKEQVKQVLQVSIPGLCPRENLVALEGGDEDYRLPITNEEILRVRLYP